MRETLTYLHGTISDKRHAITVPQTPAYLDAVLCDTALVGGLEPMLGTEHLRILTLCGFPNVTTPGMLDALNDLGFAYRWMTRWIALDKTEATRQLTKLRRHWFAKRKSIAAVLREVMFNRETCRSSTPTPTPRRPTPTRRCRRSARDDVAFGYRHDDHRRLRRGRRPRRRQAAARSSASSTAAASRRSARASTRSRPGSERLPGNPYANVRQPIVHTLNLAHLMPLSAVWAGPEGNTHLRGAAADAGADARRDTVPARSPCRRCRAHPDRRSDRRGQVGAAGDAGAAVPPLRRRAGRPVRQGPFGARRRARHERHRARSGARRRSGVPAAGPDRSARRDRRLRWNG